MGGHLLSPPGGASYIVPAATGDPATDLGNIQAKINQGLNERALGFKVALSDGAYFTRAPGLIIPNDTQKAVWLDGQGKGGTPAASHSTRLVRTTADPILSAQGTGIGAGQQVAGIQLSNMTLEGNNLAGRLLSLRACSDAVIEHIRLRNCLDTALYAGQAWNWRIYDLIVNTSGDLAGDKPAVLFTDEGIGGSQSNTVLITGSTFEANFWHDVVVDGSVASGGSSAIILAGGNKHERSGGYAVVWSRAVACIIANAFMHTNGANGLVKQINGESGVIIGNTMDVKDTSTAQEAVRLEGGLETVIAANTFNSHVVAGVPRAINIVAAGITTVEIGLNSYQGVWTNYVTDNRATPRGMSERKGHVQAFDGISTKVKNAVITDADFLKTPPDGTVVYDSLNNKIGVRSGGVWRWTAALV